MRRILRKTIISKKTTLTVMWAELTTQVDSEKSVVIDSETQREVEPPLLPNGSTQAHPKRSKRPKRLKPPTPESATVEILPKVNSSLTEGTAQ